MLLIPRVAYTDPKLKASEITPLALYQQRRDFLRLGAAAAAGAALGVSPVALALAQSDNPKAEKLANVQASPWTLKETLTPYRDITTFGNYLEFSTNKYDQTERAQVLKTKPWTVSVEGMVAKPRRFGIEEILKLAPLEERIYRHRCVEAWSMVIPWVGFPLAELLKQVQPLGSAKYVEFTSHFDDSIMGSARFTPIPWPYTEGLRLDEAMHPLTLLTVGLYGEVLPKQNGAPLRVVIPWKYGFKGAKALVKIRLLDKAPVGSWSAAQPEEYGFYANVNPKVDHKRWSQAKERRVGEYFRRDTLMFNGYAEQVASLYTGMDLAANY